MRSIFWLIILILLVAWAIGYFSFQAGGLIHALLVIAIIVILVRIISGGRIL